MVSYLQDTRYPKAVPGQVRICRRPEGGDWIAVTVDPMDTDVRGTGRTPGEALRALRRDIREQWRAWRRESTCRQLARKYAWLYAQTRGK